MKTIEEATKILTDLGAMQHQGQAVGLPCPRCGRQAMSNHMAHNALSRFIDVYICDLYGMEEALKESFHPPALPLNQWSIL